MSDTENTEVKLHWWLVSYAYFPKDGGQGFGNYVQGTNFNFFDNDTLHYARENAERVVGTKVSLTSVSYLGEMTKEQALGVKE